MGELKKKQEATAGAIRKYEAMSSDAIDAELKASGLDAGPVIANVKAMVRAKMADWQSQGLAPAMKKRR